MIRWLRIRVNPGGAMPAAGFNEDKQREERQRQLALLKEQGLAAIAESLERKGRKMELSFPGDYRSPFTGIDEAAYAEELQRRGGFSLADLGPVLESLESDNPVARKKGKAMLSTILLDKDGGIFPHDVRTAALAELIIGYCEKDGELAHSHLLVSELGLANARLKMMYRDLVYERSDALKEISDHVSGIGLVAGVIGTFATGIASCFTSIPYDPGGFLLIGLIAGVAVAAASAMPVSVFVGLKYALRSFRSVKKLDNVLSSAKEPPLLPDKPDSG